MRWSDAFSERMWFGTILILGYFVVALVALVDPWLNTEQRGMAKDALLVLGPIVGLVASSVFKTDKVDKASAAAIADLSSAAAAHAAAAAPRNSEASA